MWGRVGDLPLLPYAWSSYSYLGSPSYYSKASSILPSSLSTLTHTCPHLTPRRYLVGGPMGGPFPPLPTPWHLPSMGIPPLGPPWAVVTQVHHGGAPSQGMGRAQGLAPSFPTPFGVPLGSLWGPLAPCLPLVSLFRFILAPSVFAVF